MEAPMPISPFAVAAARRALTITHATADAFHYHPALITNDWMLLKAQRGQTVDTTRLRPLHQIECPGAANPNNPIDLARQSALGNTRRAIAGRLFGHRNGGDAA
jgi:hypothetical protein